MTQKEIVEGCLNQGSGLTRAKMEAYGINRLAHYIWLLKGEGMKIRSIWEQDFEGKRYKVYFRVVL